jgi:hypothetical protein
MTKTLVRSKGFALIGLLVCSALVGSASRAAAQSLPTPSDMIWIRTTDKTPDQVVDGIKAYIQQKKWISFGVTTITPPQGRLSIVKFCIPLVGRQLYALSLQLAALLPCGNLGVYMNQGKTEVSMLNPNYMPTLYPNAATQKAASDATPLMKDMLDTVTK